MFISAGSSLQNDGVAFPGWVLEAAAAAWCGRQEGTALLQSLFDCLHFVCLSFVLCSHECGTPPYLKNLFNPYEPVRSLRSFCMDLLTVPRTATAFGCRRFSVTGPRIWNGLPHELRQCNTVQCFKSHLIDTSLPSSHGQLISCCWVAPPIVSYDEVWRAK